MLCPIILTVIQLNLPCTLLVSWVLDLLCVKFHQGCSGGEPLGVCLIHLDYNQKQSTTYQDNALPKELSCLDAGHFDVKQKYSHTKHFVFFFTGGVVGAA